MRVKSIVASALTTLALTGAIASVASAQNGEFINTEKGPIPAHTIVTPTGPMTIPDKLIEVSPNGDTVTGVVCGYATQDQASHYAMAEIEADPHNWCLRKPGTITGPSALASFAHVKTVKRHKANH